MDDGVGHRRQEQQASFWIATDELPRSEGHVFNRQLNQLLREAGFDPDVEWLCEPYYHDTMGRPGIPPGVYFRMPLVGYFEGIGSQRGIAWRFADSLSLREFLGVPPAEDTPDRAACRVSGQGYALPSNSIRELKPRLILSQARELNSGRS